MLVKIINKKKWIFNKGFLNGKLFEKKIRN
jgi:hypothetical protein